MIYGIFGSYGRTGTYWMRDLLVSQGIKQAPCDDYAVLRDADMEALHEIAGKRGDVVFRTARPFKIHKMTEYPDTRVIIMLRDPCDIAESMETAFDRDFFVLTSAMEEAFKDLLVQAHTMRITGTLYTEVWYETVEAQWPEICAFINRPLDTPFPRLPVRGATQARHLGVPIEFASTLPREAVESNSGFWRKAWSDEKYAAFKLKCPLLMRFFEHQPMTLAEAFLSGWV
jgi:hypothetical protein